jgi:Fe-S cluster biogenesis protein NfuA
LLARGLRLRQSESRMREKVEQVIEVIRPAIQADNGDILLHDVDEATGVVQVELIGACVSCPASTVTLKAGIERILKDRVEGVTEVVDIGLAKTEIGETSVSL